MEVKNINESDESGIRALLGSIFSSQSTSSFAEISDSSFKYEVDDSVYALLRRAYESLGEILATAKSTSLMTSEEITDVHKAHRIAPNTIRLLASHTHYLEKEQNNLTVVPRMVVDRRSEIEEETYENRLILSFIQKACIYLEDAIAYFTHFFFDSDSNVISLEGVGEDKASSITIQIRTKSSSLLSVQHLSEQISTLLQDYQSLLDTPFCKRLDKAPKVLSPIHRTNIIANDPGLMLLCEAWDRLDTQTDFGLTVFQSKRSYTLSEKHTTKIKELVNSFLPPLVSTKNEEDEGDYEEEEDSGVSLTPERSLALEDEVMINDIFEILSIERFTFARQLVSTKENYEELKVQIQNLHEFLQTLREDYLALTLDQSKKNRDDRLQEKRRAKAIKLYQKLSKRGRL